MRPASRKTAADHAPVASRSTPLTAGDSTAPVSPIRLFMPKAAPWWGGSAMSAIIACAIGCMALKNVLAPKSSAAITHTDGAPPVMTSPKATVSAHCSAVKTRTRGLRPTAAHRDVGQPAADREAHDARAGVEGSTAPR
jgi:hypothetical protein